ncbi:hypothetical protein F4679DRAFT_589453 [Xylaria curta]|nr:hypothetical protein F4679DRAFT_589453 [Xylaria curta]
MSSSPLRSIEDTAAGEPSLPPVLSSGSRKRPAPSLLPPFELSSSPGLPRPLKRGAREGIDGPVPFVKYPTPIPTSSTGILSSPPRIQPSRPGLERTQSNISERAPLSAVPSIELSENGEMLCMGRSSNTSHYQLSANRLISRVHVKARYIPADSLLEPNRVEVECSGWNGLKLHCQGRTWDLRKGDTFTSETEGADIMIDVLDARVMLHWPQVVHSITNYSESTWDESPRPRARPSALALDSLQSSPIRRNARIHSPISPTPANRSSSSLDELVVADDKSEAVQIYEDASADEEEMPSESIIDGDATFIEPDFSNRLSSDLSDLEDDEINPNEENDPIIFSFGPFGADLTGRLAAVTAEAPKLLPPARSGSTTAEASAEPEEPLHPGIDVEVVTNHVVNQLAFSRLSSNPLTAIMNNLPAEEKKDLSKSALKRIIEKNKCIGVITRQGKDAAGKALESEYYYIPEQDTDESRRIAVTDGLRKPSLRACRKQHKVFTLSRFRSWIEMLIGDSNIIGSDPKPHDGLAISLLL